MTQEIAGGSRRGAGTGENTAAEGVVNEDNEFILEFGGFANDASIKKYAAQLEKSLEEKSIKPIGHFRYLGYNPPYQIIARKNEVIVAVEWKARN